MNAECNSKAAIPTQYKGVLFKSKSEAIFARALDLSDALWEYEPEHGKIGDYQFDFFIAWKWKTTLFMSYVEYKPDVPNVTYQGRLTKMVKSSGIGNSIHSVIAACGSPWNSTRKEFWYHPSEGKFIAAPNQKFISRIDEASKYRFDLNP